ncbi:hypothetical protein F5B20DRAFT_524040 [Whalleya microplaca]|nr:hypothetical protein F5B20DRAFT_524040 [Whalleya microplaca]
MEWSGSHKVAHAWISVEWITTLAPVYATYCDALGDNSSLCLPNQSRPGYHEIQAQRVAKHLEVTFGIPRWVTTEFKSRFRRIELMEALDAC